MTREKMIHDLTKHELEYLFDMNGDFDDVVHFFAKGGFNTYADKELQKKWEFLFTDTFPQGAEA
jgi:hypothetical protein